MNKVIKKVTFLLACTLLFGGISTSIVLANKEEVYTPTFATYDNHDADTYYKGISDSLTGNDLLKALRSLNLDKRKSTVGYSAMGTSPSGQFKYTDYDPDYVQYDSNGQPYGTRISSFYTYTSATSWNREHVWPNSHGGGSGGSAGSPYPDADIHMPRPTIAAENSSRGNSFFVEGMNSSSQGWDPFTAGYSKESRGEAARITFYCMLVNSKLCIAASDTAGAAPTNTDPITGNTFSSGNTMGNLYTLIKWTHEIPVTQREMNRNEGAEYLQGNRNPFVDHPEYVCRIWGKYDSTTEALCANDPYDKVAPTSITLNKSNVELRIDDTTTLSVASATPDNANKTVSWSSSDANVASVSSDGKVTGKSVGTATITATSTKDSNIKATCTITVIEPDPVALTGVSVDSSLTLSVGKTHQINAQTVPSYVYPKASFTYKTNDSSIATVTSSGLITAVAEGETTITVTATQGDNVFSSNIVLAVEKSTTIEYELVKQTNSLKEGDYVALATSLEEHANGVTGEGSNGASVDEDRTAWKHFQVKKATNGFMLYDSNANEYIASPSSNEFKYASEGGVCTVNSDGVLTCNGRYLCKNGNYNRFYSSIGSYIPFHVYKLSGGSIEPTPSPVEHIISFNANGGTGSKTAVEMESGEYTLPANPFTAPEGKEFAGWKVNNAGDILQPNTKIAVGSNITLYAQWKDVESDQVIPVSIELSNYSTEIYAGDRFFFDGDVLVTFSDGSTKDNVQLTITDPFTDTPGTVEITVTYKDKESGVSVSASYMLTIVPRPILLSIEVSGQTLEYEVGDEFSFDGTCVATYNDDTTKEVEPVVVNEIDMSTPGEKTVVLKYEDHGKIVTTSYKITVKEKEEPITPPEPEKVTLTRIEVKDYTATVKAGETYRFDGKVVAYYSDDTSREVTGYVLGTIDTSKTGSISVTVSYTEDGVTKTTSFTLTVEEAKKAASSGGCGGSITATSITLSLLSFAGISLLLLKKRKMK